MRNRRKGASANRSVFILFAMITIVFVSAVTYVFQREQALTKNDLVRTQFNSADQSGILSELGSLAEGNDLASIDYDKDTDGDGLADWEEVLWGTDENNPDSDGNGIGDKEQMFTNENTDALAVKDSSTPQEGTEDSLTEKAAHALLDTYMYTLQEGKTLTEDEQKLLAENALESVGPLMRAPTYSTKDIKTVSPSPENRVAYINTIKDLLYKMIDGVTSEHEAIYAISNGSKTWASTELKKTVAQYKHYTYELEDVAVPQDAVAIHANMMQALVFYVYTLEGFSVFDTDPLRAAASAKVFIDADQALNNSYIGMRQYIDAYSNDS